MRLSAYSVRDNVLDAYGPPMFVRNEAQLLRYLKDEVNLGPNRGSEQPWSEHPSDYAVWAIGSFDDQSGQFTPVTPVLVCQLDTLVVRKES